MESLIQKLTNSEEFLHILLDRISSALLIVDKDLQLIACNAAFLSYFKHRPHAALGQNVGTAFHCSVAMDSKKECGVPPECEYCPLRKSLLDAIAQTACAIRAPFSGYFYLEDGEKVQRHFQYSVCGIPTNGTYLGLLVL
jgi:PAS domain-containing protein